MTCLDMGLELLDHGFSVIPIKSNSKKPCLYWKEFQNRHPSTEELEAWFKRWPNANLALVTGAISNLFVVDADGPKGEEVLADPEQCPPTSMYQMTPNGVHAFYRLPHGVKMQNAVQIRSELDIRGEGGYVVIAPSEINKAVYQQVDKGGWDKLTEWVGLQPQTEPRSLKPLGIDMSQAKPILGDGDIVPKGGRNDALATMAGRFLHKGLSFDQVMERCKEWNRNQCEPHLGESELVSTVNSIARAHFRKHQANVIAAGEGSKDILPPLPSCPVEAFPPGIQEVILEAASAYVVPVEVPVAAILALASACMGRNRGIVLKKGWVEYGNLFMALVANSGLGKSPCTKAIFNSVYRIEREWHQEYQRLRATWLDEQTVFKAKHKEWVKKSKDDGEIGNPPEEPEKPVRKQVYVDDATLESLTDALDENPRGICWMRDELAGLLLDLDKYSGEKGSTRSRLLSAYDSGPWKISRVTGSKTTLIPHATLSLFGTIQPGVLPRMFDSIDALSGFLPRILFIFAQAKGPQLWSEASLSEMSVQTLDKMTDSLLEIEMTGDKPG